MKYYLISILYQHFEDNHLWIEHKSIEYDGFPSFDYIIDKYWALSGTTIGITGISELSKDQFDSFNLNES